MTTLTVSATARSGSDARRAGLLALLDRMVRAARADVARRSAPRLSDHLLRDIGLTRGDVDGL